MSKIIALRLIAPDSIYAADSVAPVRPRMIPPRGIPIRNRLKFTAGPAIAMCVHSAFWLLDLQP